MSASILLYTRHHSKKKKNVFRLTKKPISTWSTFVKNEKLIFTFVTGLSNLINIIYIIAPCYHLMIWSICSIVQSFFWPEFETSTLPSRASFCLLHRGGEKQALHKTMFPLNRITTAPEGKPYRMIGLLFTHNHNISYINKNWIIW